MALVRCVKRAFDRFAPVSLAESWDNTGLILEPAFGRQKANKVLLSIDLTTAVCDEAIEGGDVGCIVAYHPPVFRPLKNLTLEDPIQTSLVRCAATGIGIYSPHTALDSVGGGIGDSLLAKLAGDGLPDAVSIDGLDGPIPKAEAPNGQGYGSARVLTYAQPVTLSALIARAKDRLGLQAVQVAEAVPGPSKISRLGFCAGSGSSALAELGYSCDAFLTGEMSHHDILAAVGREVHVILTNHSNTERHYLRDVLMPTLQAELDASDEGKWEVVVSSRDRDPLRIA